MVNVLKLKCSLSYGRGLQKILEFPCAGKVYIPPLPGRVLGFPIPAMFCMYVRDTISFRGCDQGRKRYSLRNSYIEVGFSEPPFLCMRVSFR